MLIKTVKDARPFVVMTDEEFAQTSEQALAMSLNEIISAIDTLQKAYERMMRGVNRRIEMEMTAVKLCSEISKPEISEDVAKRIDELTKEVERLRANPPVVQQVSAELILRQEHHRLSVHQIWKSSEVKLHQ